MKSGLILVVMGLKAILEHHNLWFLSDCPRSCVLGPNAETAPILWPYMGSARYCDAKDV